ncbi:hypothetical protein CGMCC3_g5683 [Colletotrichum fructicola]|nr:uncharacterized protein CGMCC3_g5683 [Colletotrichum fructicola]KAE9578505.1 hypothetical protein CGMCC3_g5683 [Colletotrichum fructicola]
MTDTFLTLAYPQPPLYPCLSAAKREAGHLTLLLLAGIQSKTLVVEISI